MNKNRLDFQELLETITPNVYFQQPSNINMQYPAIVYSIKDMKNVRASDRVYGRYNAYDVKVIDKNPDSAISNKLMELEYCEFDRQFVTDGLNHIAFVIYY